MARRRSLGKRATDVLSDAVRRVLVAATAPLPLAWRSAFGGWLARQALRVVPGARRRMTQGLDIAFPGQPAAERARLIRDTATNIGRSQMEMFSGPDLAAHIAGIEPEGPGWQAIRDADAAGRGAIVVSGHFGQWEAVRLVLKAHGLETGAIYKPFNNPHYERAFRAACAYFGTPLFPRGGRGMRDMLRHVRGGGRVAILADQAQKSAPVLTFFGAPAHSSLSAADMALKYHVPLVPVYGLRGPGPMDFRVIFEAPVPPSDATTMTQALNDSLERMIRAHPAQWLWIHRRWKIAPRSERKTQKVKG